MQEFVSELKKHGHIYLLFLKNCLMTQMEYRANFINFIVECGFLIAKIVYAFVIYNIGISINGLSPDVILLFIGTYLIMTAIFTCFFMENFYQIPEHVRKGTLDILITKPVSLQFILTLRHANFALPLPNLGAGIALVITSCSSLGVPFNILSILGYLGTILSGSVLAYVTFLFPQLLSFWIVKTASLTEIADKSWDMNNMPMNIYNKWLQRIGVFIFPIFIIVNFPAKYLINDLGTFYLLWTVIAPILFMVGIRLFWNMAVRNYCSASS